MQTITPYLLYEDADAAVSFVTSAFGFREVDRSIGAAGGTHVELAGPGDSQLYLGAPPGGEFRNAAKVGRTSIVHVIVDDVDEHHERAKAAGAEIVEELNDLPFGHRRYTCNDPQGHQWSFAQAVRA